MKKRRAHGQRRTCWDRDRLRELRMARGWSQEDLAHACGVTWGSVSRWERGKCVPTVRNEEVLERLARTVPPQGPRVVFMKEG